jgi:hypothetical protein
MTSTEEPHGQPSQNAAAQATSLPNGLPRSTAWTC